MNLYDNVAGNYRFLSGIAPYSAGVVAMPGYEIVRVTLHTLLPWRAGFALIDRHLAALDRPRQALCGVELRLPKPLSFQGFGDFNADYRTVLVEWELLLGDLNPVARTNIAPHINPPAEPSLYAFSYTVPLSGPSATSTPTFVVAGAGDLRDQAQLTPAAVVRPGESSPAALREKAATVMAVMQERVAGLGVSPAHITVVNVYTIYPLQSFLESEILAGFGVAAVHGLHWHYSHPPIADLAFEMDVRGLRCELWIRD